MRRLEDLPGFGPKSRDMLAEIGISSVQEFLDTDPYQIYARLRRVRNNISLNMMYAILAARDGISWQEVARTRKTEILLRLDELGLAPGVGDKRSGSGSR